MVFGGKKYCLTRNLTLDYHKLTSTIPLSNLTIPHATSLPPELFTSTNSTLSEPLISLIFTLPIGFHLHPLFNQQAKIKSTGILGEEQVYRENHLLANVLDKMPPGYQFKDIE
jgi:hypothetical protein